MVPYLIFAVGPDGHFVYVREILAPSNADAVERARQMLDRHDLEVWCDGSRIGTVHAPKRV
jgi:hypothetical protein